MVSTTTTRPRSSLPHRAARGPLRRPRHGSYSRHTTPLAVFLPPDPPKWHEDEEELPPTPPPDTMPNNGRVFYKPREDSIDRLLDRETTPNTWAARNERRSLTSFRGRSQWSVGADELNESLAPNHLERHRHVLAPDEAFGAIFVWESIVNNSRELELNSWKQVAEEENLLIPDMDDIIRSEDMAAEAAIERVFYWTRDWGTIKRLVYRKAEIYEEMLKHYKFTLCEGIIEWLEMLTRYGVKTVLCSSRPRLKMEDAVTKLSLSKYFKNGDIVSAEDEYETLEQMFLVAAIKAERPPQKCVVFTDRPNAIAAAHEVSSKVIGIIGAHPAYEMKSADETVKDYNSLVVFNIRRLFSEAGFEYMDPQTQVELPN